MIIMESGGEKEQLRIKAHGFKDSELIFYDIVNMATWHYTFVKNYTT